MRTFKVYQLLSFGLITAAQVFTCLGHTMAAHLHHQRISVIPYTQPRPSSLITPPVSVRKHTEQGRPQVDKAKSELEPVEDIQFLGLWLCLDQGRASLPISKAQEIIACACQISSQTVLSYREVSQFIGALIWASGLILYEAPTTTFLFVRSDKPVYTTMSIRPFSPCHPTAMAGPIVSHIRNPYRTIKGRIHVFHSRLYSGLRCLLVKFGVVRESSEAAQCTCKQCRTVNLACGDCEVKFPGKVPWQTCLVVKFAWLKADRRACVALALA